MTYLNDEIFDQGLDYGDAQIVRVHLVSTDPGSTYATVTANQIGYSVVNPGAPVDATSGRKIVIPAVSNGTVDGTGTATHWALTDNAAIVYASGALSSSQALDAGNEFSLDAITLNILDAEDDYQLILSSANPISSYANPKAWTRIRIDDDGFLYKSEDSGTPAWTKINDTSDWVLPRSESPGTIQARYTASADASEAAQTTAARNTWYSLSGGDFDVVHASTSSINTLVVTLELRYTDGGATEASTAYTLIPEQGT